MTDITQRKLTRYKIGIPVRITVPESEDGQPQEHTTKDISAGGAFIPTDQPLPIGAEVEIDLVIPLEDLRNLNAKKAKIRINGEVIRNTGQGMAIRFEDRYEVLPAKDED